MSGRRANRAPGWRHSAETRAKISETKRKRSAERHAAELDPALKRCPHCGEYKKRWKEFHTTKRKLADGTVRLHPSSWCKICQAARTAEYKAKLRRADPVKARQQAVQYREARKARERKVRAEGAAGGGGRGQQMVDVWPLADWLASPGALSGLDDYGMAWSERAQLYNQLSENEVRGLQRACSEQGGRVSVGFVDRLLVKLGRPEMLNELYPYRSSTVSEYRGG